MTMNSKSSNRSFGNSSLPDVHQPPPRNRYESQKRRDWKIFCQYLKNHRPPLTLSRCSGAHVVEFLRYVEQFGKTKVHMQGCPFFGQPQPPASCHCPLRQAWGSLDSLIGRLRAAFEENGGNPEANPFTARAIRLYLREIRDDQEKARGIAAHQKKRRKSQARQQQQDHRQELCSTYIPLPPSCLPTTGAMRADQRIVSLNLVNGVYTSHPTQQFLFESFGSDGGYPSPMPWPSSADESPSGLFSHENVRMRDVGDEMDRVILELVSDWTDRA